MEATSSTTAISGYRTSSGPVTATMTAIDVKVVRRMHETNRSAATRLSRMSERSRHVPSPGRPPLSRRAVHHPVCPDCPEGPRLAPDVLNLRALPVLDLPMGAEQARPLKIS